MGEGNSARTLALAFANLVPDELGRERGKWRGFVGSALQRCALRTRFAPKPPRGRENRHPELAKDLAWNVEARCFAALNMTATYVRTPKRKRASLFSGRDVLDERQIRTPRGGAGFPSAEADPTWITYLEEKRRIPSAIRVVAANPVE